MDRISFVTAVGCLLKAIHKYNESLIYNGQFDQSSLMAKGSVLSLVDLFKESGYSLSYGVGDLWSNSFGMYMKGIGHVSFGESAEELSKTGVSSKYKFINGTYWFVENSGELVRFKENE